MTERSKKYLSDINIAIDLIEQFMVGISTYGHYQEDMKTQSAIERQLSIIVSYQSISCQKKQEIDW